MTFTDSIKTCFQKYADFNGKASRSEYWYWVLFYFIASIVLSIIHPYAGTVFALLVILPTLAVAARRLHDTGRSGWWQLIGLVPVVGFIVLIVFFAQQCKPEAVAAAA